MAIVELPDSQPTWQITFQPSIFEESEEGGAYMCLPKIPPNLDLSGLCGCNENKETVY